MSSSASSSKRKFTILVESADSSEVSKAPLLASFHGQAPHDSSNLIFQSEPLNEASGSKGRASAAKKIEATGKNVVYKGIARPSKSSSSLTKYAVGIISPGANTIRLQEAMVVDFKVIPKSKLAEYEASLNPATNTSANNANKKTSIVEARNLLGETFGNKKRKQEIKSMERSKIDVDDLKSSAGFIAASIDQKSVTIPDQESLKADGMQDSIVPPFNLEATEADQSYPLDQLISASEMHSLNIKHLTKLSAEEKNKISTDSEYPSFVAVRLYENLISDHIDHEKVKCLLYLSYLLKFRACKESVLNNPTLLSKELKNIPQPVLESFFARFTESFAGANGGSVKYKVSARLKDKILCYILVLAFKLNDFVLNVTELSQDLLISVTKLTECCRFVGARASTSSKKASSEGSAPAASARMYKLEAPLQFPKPRLGRKKQ